jgi:hypothetical protein
MIPIEKEPFELFEEFKVFENCIFCDNQTDRWNIETNRPVCVACSQTHTIKDLQIIVFNESFHKQRQINQN